jgi:lysophospholipase L1-like esterase
MRIENDADRRHRPATGKWVPSWTAAMQGPAPAGVPAAQPDMSLALPGDEARDQTFRMVFRPDLWGHTARLRFCNAFGDRPVAIDDVSAALHWGSGALVPFTSSPVLFGGADAAAIPPGGELLSDPFELPFIADPADPALHGRRLAVSFHVRGASGPLTWHAKAMSTSYLSPPGSGARGAEESDAAFPFSTTAWYLLDGLDVVAPADTLVVAGLGDSITDGTFSTLNGDDRWTDRLSRRLRLRLGGRVSVVNLGIGGNQVIGPEVYPPPHPFNGGPSALSRLDRDIISRAGITHVVWMEGVNDFGQAMAPEGTPPAEPEAVIDGFRRGVERMRAQGLRVIGGTLPPALNAERPSYATADVDARRRRVNDFIRYGGLFDGVVDFEAATMDPATGEMKAMFQPNTTIGGPGDRLHPNRAGYLAMGDAVDLALFEGDA